MGYHVHYCREGGAEHEWLCHGLRCAPARHVPCARHGGKR